MYRKTIFAGILMWSAMTASAQSGTNSPYSQYGFGTISEQAGGPGRGMNGLGIAYREHNQVNALNPASYASLDSITFIFDVGLSGQLTNFKENGKSVNAKNANFEYVMAGFRLARRLGLSFGVLPYTNVGYSYSTSQKIDASTTDVFTTTFTGKGGLHEAYLGLGWEPIKGISFGVNGGYLWGGYDRTVSNSYSDSHVNTLSKTYSASVRNYKLDFGLQLSARLSKKDQITLGATYGIGHKIGGKPSCQVISFNPQTSVADTVSYPRNGELDLEIPTSFGAGLMWYHDGKIKIGVDYTLQKWSSVKSAEYAVVDNVADLRLTENCFRDRHKVSLGAEICPGGEMSRKFLGRIRYRAGVAYATPYLKINGHDGPKELTASLGFGIPILHGWNKPSFLNISAQYVRQDCKQFITENTFRINIGLTFSERWFDKWKVE
ncbi:MAG: hypothetical protein IJ605_04055 [Prevotella sp.]|nr:hypothetical protein [Prevotella sp.]